ncbi:MAG: M20/M25/M40 family metallo-hydrolase [Dissulfurispiraceae bacterium]|jgi:tripeptide aminopeptidase|nr:M20/M25/M40 family metallo-hydrolase [Dissulfurispiraceae bacterium]
MPAVNRKRITDLFVQLAKINSPSFKERGLGEFVSGILRSEGCDVRFQEYGESFNLIAYKKGAESSRQPIMLSAHLDTIEPTDGIIIDVNENAVRSAGPTVLGADDKSAVAQIIEALRMLNEHEVKHGDIEIVLTSAEETGLIGAKNLDYSMIKSRHALVLDSGGRVGRAVVSAPTHYTYKMVVKGRSAHAGIEPEKGINAITAAAKVITALPDGRIDSETTANIGIISGGTATNVVPKEVFIRAEMRSRNAGTLESLKNEIFESARSAASVCGAEIEITGQEEYAAFNISSDDQFLKYIESVFRSCGIEPELSSTGGGSDANIFNKNSITAINISNGMQSVHSTDEFILIEDLCRGAEIVFCAVRDFVAA